MTTEEMTRALADDLLIFVQSYLGSVWALKLMLAMRESADKAWTVEGLVRHLRASDALIAGLLNRFARLGLVMEDGGVWRWQPATPEIEEMSRGIADAYAVTPFGVIQAIAEIPESRLREFANAFRVRRE